MSSFIQSSSRVTWTIDKINENMITNTQLQLQLHELSDLINRVATQQNLMRTFAEHEPDLNNQTMMNFADWTVSPNDNAIQGLLERLHLLITGSADLKAVGSTGLLELIANNLQVSVCGLGIGMARGNGTGIYQNKPSEQHIER